MEQHLSTSEECFSLYIRQLHVTEMDAVLVKLYRCIACSSTGNFQLTRHFNTNPACFRYYKRKFDVLDINQLKKKLTNLTRTAHRSRTQVRRRIEMQQVGQRSREAKTVVDSLNDFHKQTSLGLHLLCVICEQHYLRGAVQEVSITDPIYEELNLDQKKYLKRLGKYWLCTACKGSLKKPETKMGQSMLKSRDFDGTIVLHPVDTIVNEDINITCDTTILIPRKCPPKMLQYNSFSPNIYSLQSPNNKLISTLYQIRLNKFNQRKIYSDLYDGEVQNNTNSGKTLHSINKIIDDSCIRGSDSWKNSRRASIHSQFSQFGTCCIGFNFDIAMINREIVASSLICEGKVVTIDYIGNTSNEFETIYKLHNHTNEIECSDSCVLSEITLPLTTLDAKLIPVFISDVHNKQIAFHKNFVKNVNYEMHAEDYNIGIEFYNNGEARITGILWTKMCSEFNHNLANKSFTGESFDEETFLHYIEATIFTSSKCEELRKVLNAPDEEILKLHELIKKFQIEYDLAAEYVPLPSWETMYRLLPEENAKQNIISSKKLLLKLKSNLLLLSRVEKERMTIKEWLQIVSKKSKLTMITDDCLEIQLETLIEQFTIDKRLEALITKYGCFTALYQYSLACSKEEYSIVLQRKHILDCFTLPFNITMLKAFKSRVEVVPLNSELQFWDFQDKYSNLYPSLENSDLKTLLEDHSIVSLPELFALSDQKKVIDIYSSPTCFISTFESNKPKFRKIATRTEDCFECPGKGFFVQLSSNVLRHKQRLNGDTILLVESCLHYDVLSSTESIEKFNIFKDKIDKIPLANEVGVYGVPFPEYILCSNKQVMKLREAFKNKTLNDMD